MIDAQAWPPGVQPYAVARPELAARGSHPLLAIDPTRSAHAPFLHRLERLDRSIYAPSGMATPRWALYDCAELPGTIYGACARAEALPREACLALESQPDDRPLPLTAVVAIPTVEADHWLVYAVFGLQEVVETGLPDLRARTLSDALAWLGAREVTTVCQWAGDRIALHLACGDPELRAAWMPSHTEPASCCLHYAPGAPAPSDGGAAMWLSAADEAALRELQSEIEAGRRYRVVASREGASGTEIELREGGRR